ncbi:MAG: endonuclease/exonuclease/phosphatase family protein [Bacteroidia bacterium]|nr:endonuclease/exonuclease/phosphatase family protein [Bacteroidia bacterium]
MKSMLFLLLTFVFCSFQSCSDEVQIQDTEIELPTLEPDTIRFAVYNVSMFGSSEGLIASQLENADQYIRFKRIASVIQKVSPDVLVLMEFDYDSTGNALRNFNDQLLAVSQNGDSALIYPYTYQIDSNTGELSSVDIDGNGSITLPNDAYGFGQFKGQYASAILSTYPLDTLNSRSFRKFLWKDMPNAALPLNADSTSYYSDDALNVFRLSSKNHIDIPIVLSENKTVHALISHPTPPVFDGAEDRNGKRNHDEIRLWADYIDNAGYLVDDEGQTGGLNSDDSFIIFGDLNADPNDGDSYQSAINQLLNHSKVNTKIATGNLIPSSNGGAEHNQKSGDIGDPKYDTSFFGLRIDYVLPSADINALDSGVFWPASGEDGDILVKNEASSDHLMVWADLIIER